MLKRGTLKGSSVSIIYTIEPSDLWYIYGAEMTGYYEHLE
nr:MAG TPA: hypothetical protein [Caudoviricetes sp.]